MISLKIIDGEHEMMYDINNKFRFVNNDTLIILIRKGGKRK